MNEKDWRCRTKLLIQEQGVKKLQNAHILVVGLGGVGGYTAEQLIRAGIGKLTLVDNDTVHASNKNRQIIALDSTQETLKCDSIKKRFLDINPDSEIVALNSYLEGDKAANLILKNKFDYIVDAIDTLTPKVDLLEACIRSQTPTISSMGSGARLDPTQIKVAPIEESHHCKLAYLVRKRLHQRGLRDGVKVVFSPEPVPSHALVVTDGSNNKRTTVGTISYMPAIFGCFAAAQVIQDLLKD